MADEEIKDQSNEPGTETEEGGGSQYNASPELEAMIADYGLELGVEFFRRGLSDEDAKSEALKLLREENASLKASPKKLAEEDQPKPAEDAAPPADEKPADDETQKLRAEIKTLSASTAKLSAELAKLKRGRGETEPLSMSGETMPQEEEKKAPTFCDTLNYYANQAVTAKPFVKK